MWFSCEVVELQIYVCVCVAWPCWGNSALGPYSLSTERLFAKRIQVADAYKRRGVCLNSKASFVSAPTTDSSAAVPSAEQERRQHPGGQQQQPHRLARDVAAQPVNRRSTSATMIHPSLTTIHPGQSYLFGMTHSIHCVCPPTSSSQGHLQIVAGQDYS